MNMEQPLSPNTAAELAIQNRKFAKTCVEKKRRDRINKCLDELKEIMSQTDDKARYQKMEKAEILEMAVNYMRVCMSGKVAQPSADVYALAYNQLLTELAHCLTLMPGLRDDLKAHVLTQLSSNAFRKQTPSTTPASSTSPQSQQSQQSQHGGDSHETSPQSVAAPKRRRGGCETNQQATTKKVCVDTTSHQAPSSNYFMYASKYGGSCSSLDNQHPVSPCGSSTSSSSSTNENQALNLSSSSSTSSNSSPPISACSSPNSSSSKSWAFTKIFRPIDLP